MKQYGKYQSMPAWKRVVSLFLALFMVLTMAPISVPTAKAADTVTVKAHFENTDNWSNVYAYAWNTSGNLLGSWPGTQISANADHEGYFSTELTGVNAEEAFNIIFNNGSDGQTGDLTVSSADLKADADGIVELWVSGKGGSVSLVEPEGWTAVPTPATVTVKAHFENTDNWSSVYAYAWNTTGTLYGNWPGTQIAANADHEGYFSVELTEVDAENAFNIIFNNSSEQTGDLTVSSADLKADADGIVELWVSGKGGSVSLVEPEGWTPVENETVTIKAHFDNTGSWTAVYAHYWIDAAQDQGLTSWPGVALTEDSDGYYTLEVSDFDADNGFGVVFNNQGYGSQTADLVISSDVLKADADGVVEVWATAASTEFSDTEPTETVISPEVDGTKVTFRYVSTTATKVEVFGSMNGWASGYEMTKGADGIWSYTMEMTGGTYQYKFVVNGSDWINDPLNTAEKVDGNNVFTTVGEIVPDKFVTIKAYLQNTAGWSNVHGYAWVDGSTTLLGGWPGTAATAENGFYSVEVTDFDASKDFNFIFNNGSGGEGNQTADLKISSADLKADEDGVITVWVTANGKQSLTGPNANVVTPVLESMNIVGVKGEVIALPAKLDYTAHDASQSKQEVTYTLKNADASVELDAANKTVKVPVDYAKDMIELTATAESGATATVKVILTDDVSNEVLVKIHYSRPDGDYTDWNVWMWADNAGGLQYDFVEEDGEMVATYEIENGLFVNKVGFIVRKGDWDAQEGGDRFVDLSNVVAGTVHCYVVSGQNAFTQDNGDAVNGIKIVTAVYDRTTNKVVVTMSEECDCDVNTFVIDCVSDDEVEIKVTAVKDLGDAKYELTIDQDLTQMEDLFETYTITHNNNVYPLTMPNVYSTDEFENAYTYTGNDLGATWTADGTTFKVWAPTADIVYVNLYQSGTEGTNDLIEKYDMHQGEQGVWYITIPGDLNGTYYTYTAYVNGKINETCDPYARTTGVNGDRAMVIDLDSTDPEGWDQDVSPNKDMSYTDAIIYELHVRDLSSDSGSGIKNTGKFLGLTERGTTNVTGQSTGLDHIIDLGVTHIHLLPVYDYASVDETRLDEAQYNWGYDPQNYNVPEGSYSTDPYNGAVRIKEMKQMIMALHESNINVIMDVVYNHVYDAGTFSVNMLVPKYFSRTNADGSYSNGSGCGNDTASERAMVRKYIVDSVLYWAEEYHIDGFRFDLVGLLDAETINQIVAEVHAINPDVIFYGEGWTMGTAVSKENVTMATQQNASATPNFAYFSDTIRDLLRGGNFNETDKGFVSGVTGVEQKVINNFMANPGWTSSPIQIINYVSCHDNYTLFDKLNVSAIGASAADIVKMNNLSAAIYMMAEGIPLIHAGEEILRTKMDEEGVVIHNSYKSSDYVNSIKWATLNDETYQNVFEYYKGLIAFRKNHTALRLTTTAEVNNVVKAYTVDSNMVMFVLDGTKVTDEVSDQIVIIFNANNAAKSFSLYNNYGVTQSNAWQVCVNGEKAGIDVIETITDGNVTVAPLSALVLVLGDTEDTESVYTLNEKTLVESVALNTDAAQLYVGETEQLTVMVVPENAYDQTVTWTSSDESVVTVDANGMVTAVSVGTATITAEVGYVTAECVVTVNPVPVENVTLDQESAELNVGDTITLNATVSPENAADATVIWTSSDESVATVDANGVVTAIAEGTAIITVAAGDKTAECTVNVVIPVVEPGDVYDATQSENNAFGAKIEQTIEELAEIMFTAEELQRIEAGEDAAYGLFVEALDAVPENEQALVKAQLGSDLKIAFCADITLLKQLENSDVEQITETETPIRISLTIPEEWINQDPQVTREFGVIRVHNGVAEKIDSSVEGEDYLEFETDKFSTYVVYYKDTQKSTEGGNGSGNTGNISGGITTTPEQGTGADTGDHSNNAMWIVMMAVCVLAVVVVIKKRRMV